MHSLGQAALDRLDTVPTKLPNVSTDRFQPDAPKRIQARLLKASKVSLTQDKAAWYINLPVFPGERDVTEAHVQTLLDKMIDGIFNPDLVILATCILNGVTYKINGQHTCWAKFNLPRYTPEVEEQSYEADTPEQLKLLYGQFDTNKPRNQSHVLRVHLIGEVALDGLWSDTVKRLCAGLRMWHYRSREEERRAKAEHLVYLAKNQFPDLMQTVGLFWQSLDEAGKSSLKRSPCFAALLATFHKDATAAPKFWTGVAIGAELRQEDPRLTLRNYLLTTALQATGRGSRKVAVDQDSMFWCCLLAWNKWRANSTMKVMKTPSSRPEVK